MNLSHYGYFADRRANVGGPPLIRKRLDLRRSCLLRISLFLLVSGIAMPVIAGANGVVWLEVMAWLWLASDTALFTLILGLRRLRTTSQPLPAQEIMAAHPTSLGCVCGRSREPGAVFCDACGRTLAPRAHIGETIRLP